MTRLSTNMDLQRATFVESLYGSLKKQAAKAVEDHDKIVTLASSYLADGLEESECVELLMIDGLHRDSAESYTAMAMANALDNEDLSEYTFQFEDSSGKLWSSFDIGKTVQASSSEDAWTKTEEMLFSHPDFETERIVTVTRIS
ncbi:hypothetical protein D4R86_00790 [bacterium]|nr:MAG: hypothetical protein D4R86_00790 [bacterium]